MIYTPKQIAVTIFECSDANIKSLPFDSQINVLLAQLENTVYDICKLKEYFYVPSDDYSKCYFYGAVDSNLVRFIADIEKITDGDKSLFRIINCKSLLNAGSDAISTEITLQKESNTDDKPQPVVEVPVIFTSDETEPKEDIYSNAEPHEKNPLIPAALEICSLVRKNKMQIENIDKSLYSIHTYEQFRNTEDKAYPYIYQKDGGYEIVHKNSHINSCKSALGAKLYVAFYKDKNARATIDRLLNVSDTKELYHILASQVSSQHIPKNIKGVYSSLSHMGCDFITDHIILPNV